MRAVSPRTVGRLGRSPKGTTKPRIRCAWLFFSIYPYSLFDYATHRCMEVAPFQKRKEISLQPLGYRLHRFTVRQSLVRPRSCLPMTQSPTATPIGSGSNFPIRLIFVGLLMILIYMSAKFWYVPRRDQSNAQSRRSHIYSDQTNSSQASRTFLMCGALRPTTFSSGTKPINGCGNCTFFVDCVK